MKKKSQYTLFDKLFYMKSAYRVRSENWDKRRHTMTLTEALVCTFLTGILIYIATDGLMLNNLLKYSVVLVLFFAMYYTVIIVLLDFLKKSRKYI